MAEIFNASKEELHEAIKSDNPETIKSALDKFAQASMKIGEAVYKQQQANQGENQQDGNQQEGSGDHNNPTEEKVVDGEKA